MSAIGSAAGGTRGFTLMEMLVVLGITALVAGLGFPAIERMRDGASFTSAVRLTELALRQAHADAVRGGRAVRFAADNDGAALFVSGRPLTPLPAPARLQAPADGILFLADGSASGGDLLLSAGARRRAFRVSPDSGAIETPS